MAYEYRPLVGENYRYKTDSEKPFKISRSKIELFYNCQRCFFNSIIASHNSTLELDANGL